MVDQPALRGEPAAGAVLARSGPLAGLLVLVVCLAAAVLVPVGQWRPTVAGPVLLLGAVGAWRLVVRIPSRPVPVWTASVAVAASAGFALWAGLTHAEHVIVRRDAGSYALYAQWIAQQHALPVDARLSAFGGLPALAVPGFTVASPAFFQVARSGPHGVVVVPQFLLGAPALYSLGWWAHGWAGMFVVPAVLGGAALLAVAALTARLVGPTWAGVAAVTLGLTQPVLHVSRSTYSEPAALLLALTGACLVVDAVAGGVRPGAVATRRLAGAAGAVFGLAGLVRVDAVLEVALLLPVCAVLAVRRHRAAGPLAAGALAGLTVSVVAAVALSRPYLESVRSSLLPLIAGGVAVAALSAAAVPLGRRRRVEGVGGPGAAGRTWGVAGRRWSTVGAVAAGTVLLLGLVLATRPWWLVARQGSPDDPAAGFVERLQVLQGQAGDGRRTYAEDSLTWVTWWSGPLTPIAAWFAAAAAAARAARPALWGPRPAVPPWLAPAVVGLGSSVLTLYRPGITPDHPWADRRLVPFVLPTMVVGGVAAAAWCVRRARRRAPAWAFAATAAVAVAALVVPAARGSWPVATVSTERGEPAAVAAVCSALLPGDVVIAVDGTAAGSDGRSANEWPQVIRGVCGRPSAVLHPGPRLLAAQVARMRALVAGAGGRLVLLAAGDQPPPDVLLRSLGGSPVHVAHLVTSEDARSLTGPGDAPDRLLIDVWLAALGPAS